MKGFGIYIQNDLLEPKHIAAMQDAVWLFMWLEDKVTIKTPSGDGIVLGGKPVKYAEVNAELGISQDVYTRWIDLLEAYPYIEVKRAPYGLIYKVLNSKKRFRVSPERFRKTSEVDSENTRNVIKTNQKTNQDKSISATAKAVAEPEKQKKEKKPDDSNEPMTLQEFLKWCRASTQRHVRLIAEYADERGVKHTTKGQWRQFITRNLRAAKSLAPYTDDQIGKAIKLLLKDTKEQGGFMTKWTLETVVKYID